MQDEVYLVREGGTGIDRTAKSFSRIVIPATGHFGFMPVSSISCDSVR